MTETEKLAMTRSLLGITNALQDSALTVYLTIAGRKIINKAFPYDAEQSQVPQRYDSLQCEIAAYLWNKRGAEGEVSHSENGISRSYENADVPSSMLSEVVPYCGVIKAAKNE